MHRRRCSSPSSRPSPPTRQSSPLRAPLDNRQPSIRRRPRWGEWLMENTDVEIIRCFMISSTKTFEVFRIFIFFVDFLIHRKKFGNPWPKEKKQEARGVLWAHPFRGGWGYPPLLTQGYYSCPLWPQSAVNKHFRPS